MRPERTFVAERALASHCPEVLGGGALRFDALPAMAKLGAALAPLLAVRLASLAGGEAPQVTSQAPRNDHFSAMQAHSPGLSACCLFGAGETRLPFVAQVDARAVFVLVDRAFGGRGTVPDPLPDALPLSADLMAGQLMHQLAEVVGRAAEANSPVSIVRRAAGLGELDAFAGNRELAVLELAIADENRAPWHITLGFPAEALAALLAPESKPGTRRAHDELSDPLAEPFGAMPLTLTATLVDMQMPINAISALRPGALLPVSVARDVPLATGGTALAHGTVGAIDDRVALRLTRAFSDSPTKGTA